MRTVLALVFFAFGSVAVLAQQPKPPVRVYVWTDKVGIEECVGYLTGKLDAKWLVASSKDASEIQVEIVGLESPGAVTIIGGTRAARGSQSSPSTRCFGSTALQRNWPARLATRRLLASKRPHADQARRRRRLRKEDQGLGQSEPQATSPRRDTEEVAARPPIAARRSTGTSGPGPRREFGYNRRALRASLSTLPEVRHASLARQPPRSV